MSLALFTGAWFMAVYVFHSVLARSFKRINIGLALLYGTTVSLIGVFGEVFGNTLYHTLFGTPLWLYHYTPVHGGYTSIYSTVVWFLYGFYLYLMHDNLSTFNYRTRVLALIIAIEAIILELLFNGTFYLLRGDYFFYYIPGDLWHFTTIQAIPFYFLAGAVMVKTLRRFKSDPLFLTAMNVLLVAVFVGLAG